jgi:GNAT superfamily N-acetyltransferase
MSGTREPRVAPGGGSRDAANHAGASGARVRPARREDVPRVWELVRALAEYERLTHEVTGGESELEAALFSDPPAVECLVLDTGDRLTGYALFFPVFSSFRTKPRMWLEDLYVEPETRGTGGGRLLLAALARLSLERGISQMGWVVLDWNGPSIEFYKRLGGYEVKTSDWLQYRFDAPALKAIAGFGSATETPAKTADRPG